MDDLVATRRRQIDDAGSKFLTEKSMDAILSSPAGDKIATELGLGAESLAVIAERRKIASAKTATAYDFFNDMAKRDMEAEQRDLEEAKRLSEYVPSVLVEIDGPEEVDPDDAYCLPFRDNSNICSHCVEPLPINPSVDLLELKAKLDAAAVLQPDGMLPWRQTITFCTMHRAETSIIPIGMRDGLPGEIDFAKLDERLEEGFVRLRLRRIAAKPYLSMFFRKAAREVEKIGIVAWKAVGNQSKESSLALVTPGYYGELGRAVIIQHFQHLSKWGYLPSLQSKAIQPLSAPDFIANVLVPEAAVLLIMADRGWKLYQPCEGPEWDIARAEATALWRRSGQFGRWRFREDGENGRRIICLLERTAEAKRIKLESQRRRETDEKARLDIRSWLTEHPVSSIRGSNADDANCGLRGVVPITESDTPDPSEYAESDDEDGGLVTPRQVTKPQSALSNPFTPRSTSPLVSETTSQQQWQMTTGSDDEFWGNEDVAAEIAACVDRLSGV